jgi:hypothetical protein
MVHKRQKGAFCLSETFENDIAAALVPWNKMQPDAMGNFRA